MISSSRRIPVPASSRAEYPLRRVGCTKAEAVQSFDASVGNRFVGSLLARDWAGVEAIVDPAVDFRGLTPGALWEAASAKSLVESVFQVWFGPDDDISEVVSVVEGRISTRNS